MRIFLASVLFASLATTPALGEAKRPEVAWHLNKSVLVYEAQPSPDGKRLAILKKDLLEIYPMGSEKPERSIKAEFMRGRVLCWVDNRELLLCDTFQKDIEIYPRFRTINADTGAVKRIEEKEIENLAPRLAVKDAFRLAQKGYWGSSRDARLPVIRGILNVREISVEYRGQRVFKEQLGDLCRLVHQDLSCSGNLLVLNGCLANYNGDPWAFLLDLPRGKATKLPLGDDLLISPDDRRIAIIRRESDGHVTTKGELFLYEIATGKLSEAIKAEGLPAIVEGVTWITSNIMAVEGLRDKDTPDDTLYFVRFPD